MGGNINFGSRTEFLPGEGTNELDIKYQRYGGCFVTYKKGFVYVLASVLFAAIVGFLIYHYYSCSNHDLNGNESIDKIVEEISKSASTQTKNDSEKSNLKSVISNNVNPLYYRLKIHPYLNDNSDKKFTFEGHVTIVFQITGSPTKTIILNAKNFVILDTDVSLTYSSTSLLEPQSAAYVLEENTDSLRPPPESGALLVEETTTLSPLDATTTKEDIDTIAPPEDFTTNVPLFSDNDTTTSLPEIGIPQNDAPSDDKNKLHSANDSVNKGEETTTTAPEKQTKTPDNVNSEKTPPPNENKDTSLPTEFSSESTMSSSDDAPIIVTAPTSSLSTEKKKPTSESFEPSSDTTQTFKDEENTDNEDNDPISVDPITTIASTISSTTESTVVKVAEKINVQIIKKKYNNKEETYLIKTKLPLETSVNYTLVMKYKGKITDKLGGLYKTSYKKNNATIWIAHSILKPSYARTVFPCFDEPHLKSRFEISVARLTNMSVVSNMQLQATYSEGNSSGWVWDHFKISPYMAPHSVGFALLPFESIKSPASVPLPLTKLWARKEVMKKATYILKIAPEIIKSYNKLFNYNYSLHKIDFVAVPNLPVTSISSWGIIFLRENDLMVSEELSSYEDKENLLEILSREIAKQWFGHVVSLHSWIDSWFMETIASYSHYIAMKTIEPSWNLLDKASIIDAQEVLDVDSLDILPKITTISSNTEAQDLQQKLLNKKGGLILRSIDDILNEGLEKGIQNIVTKWKYKSFKAENVWKELSNTTLTDGIKLNDIINKWTTQEGYPLITATRNNESNKITLLQSRFMDNNSTSNKAYWPLKLSYISSTTKDTKFEWLVNTSPKVIENAVDEQENSWIFFNLNRTSLCRVNYDLNNWNSLIFLLKSKPDELSPANRAQLLDDAFHLARSGILNYTIALDMSLYLKDREDHILPWTVLLKNFEYLNLLFSKTLYYGNFQDFVIKLIEPLFKTLKTNIDNKSYEQVTLRKIIFQWACKFNYKPCRDWAYSQYETWESIPDNEPNPIASDLRSTVYCVGVQNLGRKAWEFLWKKYTKQANNSDEINALISGMSCATESWLILKYLHRALDEENIQYSVTIWNALSSEMTIDVAFDFLKDNWNKIIKKYNSIGIKQILSKLLEQLTTEYDLDQVTNFYSKYKSDLQNYAHDIFAIIKKLQLKLNWKEKYLNDFNSWLELTNI